mmetsp:Transcript_8455/g.18230  ORF Transcript_8455/g.18230 Transcript_8455/m.18230 type:complete len:554 (+) Transcript_8455:210-1871(+)
MEEQEAESKYERANEEVESILGTTKPKHIGEGISSGLGCILRGAVGACGAVVLFPTICGVEGQRHGGGIFGGVTYASTGAVAGVVIGADCLGGGLVTGVSQIARGVAATPNAIIAPSRGYWWNGASGKWMQTYLLEEERWINGEPKYDEDILGEMALPEDERTRSGKAKVVKDMYYYDKLGLDCDVDLDTVERKYNILSRKYDPIRCGINPEAQTEFQEMGRAYAVLRSPDLRKKYDRVGREGLWFEDDDDNENANADPMILYTLLFGSEKFNDHIGRLAAVTSTRIGCEVESKLTMAKSRLLQKRRVTRLALKLAERLSVWAEDNDKDSATKNWQEEALFLCDSSYGEKLVRVIGKVYTFTAIYFLGSIESGIGMPSISRWAKKQSKAMKLNKKMIGKTLRIGGNVENRELHWHVGTAIEKSVGDKELKELAMEALKKSHLQQTSIELLWQQTVVDITTAVKEAAQMVLNDLGVPPEVRKARAKGLEVCGGIFEKVERNGNDDGSAYDEKELEQVAFHAMLNTVWRQEAARKKRRDEKLARDAEERRQLGLL